MNRGGTNGMCGLDVDGWLVQTSQQQQQKRYEKKKINLNLKRMELG
jgi:hypothetical protein